VYRTMAGRISSRESAPLLARERPSMYTVVHMQYSLHNAHTVP